jgi:hypothetical protein
MRSHVGSLIRSFPMTTLIALMIAGYVVLVSMGVVNMFGHARANLWTP